MTQNPKAAEGAKKAPLHLLPPVALEQIAWAHKAGSDIYGPFNWRTQPIQMTTYVAALLRHTLAWAGGEDIDPKSGLSHLAHIGANVNLLLDAAHCGTLVDDRPKMPVKRADRMAGLKLVSVTLRCNTCGKVFARRTSDPLPKSDICDPCQVKRVSQTTGYPRSGSKQPLSDEPGWVPPTPLPPGFSEDFAVPTGMNGIQSGAEL